MEEPLFLTESVFANGLCNIGLVHFEDVDTTVGMSWDEESVGNNKAVASVENVIRDSRNFIWPFERCMFDLMSFSFFDIVIDNIVSYIWNDIDVTRSNRASSKGRDNKEFVRVLKFTDLRECSILKFELT